VNALVLNKSSASSASIVAFITGKRTVARVNMLVLNKSSDLSASIVAFVTGERTVARVNTLVMNKIAAARTSVVAFVTGKRTLARVNTLVDSKITAIRASIVAFVACKQTGVLLAHSTGATSEINPHSMIDEQFSALHGIECCFDIAACVDGFVADNFALEGCLDGACNQILLRIEIAREFSLERLSKGARRKSRLCVDGSPCEMCDRVLENLVRYLTADAGRQRFRGHDVLMSNRILLIWSDLMLLKRDDTDSFSCAQSDAVDCSQAQALQY
jgi:hypothetical protein